MALPDLSRFDDQDRALLAHYLAFKKINPAAAPAAIQELLARLDSGEFGATLSEVLSDLAPEGIPFNLDITPYVGIVNGQPATPAPQTAQPAGPIPERGGVSQPSQADLRAGGGTYFDWESFGRRDDATPQPATEPRPADANPAFPAFPGAFPEAQPAAPAGPFSNPHFGPDGLPVDSDVPLPADPLPPLPRSDPRTDAPLQPLPTPGPFVAPGGPTPPPADRGAPIAAPATAPATTPPPRGGRDPIPFVFPEDAAQDPGSADALTELLRRGQMPSDGTRKGYNEPLAVPVAPNEGDPRLQPGVPIRVIDDRVAAAPAVQPLPPSSFVRPQGPASGMPGAPAAPVAGERERQLQLAATSDPVDAPFVDDASARFMWDLRDHRAAQAQAQPVAAQTTVTSAPVNPNAVPAPNSDMSMALQRWLDGQNQPPTQVATSPVEQTASPVPSTSATPLPSNTATAVPSTTATPIPADVATTMPTVAATPVAPIRATDIPENIAAQLQAAAQTLQTLSTPAITQTIFANDVVPEKQAAAIEPQAPIPHDLPAARMAVNSIVPEGALNLTADDREYLARVAALEADPRSGEAYTQQVHRVIDTVLNRVASDEFADGGVADVINQRRQFTGVAPYGGVENAPTANAAIEAMVNDWLDQRQTGTPSSVGGSLHYANPDISDASNMGWINTLSYARDDAGPFSHVYGTAPGFHPVEAALVNPRPMASAMTDKRDSKSPVGDMMANVSTWAPFLASRDQTKSQSTKIDQPSGTFMGGGGPLVESSSGGGSYDPVIGKVKSSSIFPALGSTDPSMIDKSSSSAEDKRKDKGSSGDRPSSSNSEGPRTKSSNGPSGPRRN